MNHLVNMPDPTSSMVGITVGPEGLVLNKTWTENNHEVITCVLETNPLSTSNAFHEFHADDEHHLHHHDHDPDHHRTDGYGSESDSSDEDVEVATPTEDDMKLRKFGRRRAISNTKFGAWNRHIVGSFEVKTSEKNQAHHDILMNAVKHDELFKAAVERGQTELIVSAFEVVSPSPHTHLVDVGTPADALFIVLEGTVECSACGHGKKQAANLKAGQCFGDESLLWHTNWTFTAEAGPHCVLGKMPRTVFNKVVVEKGMEERERRIQCLHMCELFETFNDEQIAKIVEVMNLRVYHPGEVIMREGQPGHHLFVLESGQCKVFCGTQDFSGVPREILGPGALFGDKALLNHSARVKSVVADTDVEVLVLSRGKFERLLGPLEKLAEEHAKTDPRQIIASFFQKGTQHGPSGVTHSLQVDATHAASHWFAVFRPTSRDAITKLVSGQGVGKGLNVKGKSAKKGALSGFVPFLQISSNDHKHELEQSPVGAWLKVFYRSVHAREEAENALTKILNNAEYRKHIELENPQAKPEELLIRIDSYSPKTFGLKMPETLLHEAYIELQDMVQHAGWETGRASEPAFMDMNFHAIRDQAMKPEIVLWQFDEAHPMNPHGLLVAYAEDEVKPVVSDFDAFLVSSKGMDYESLPADQLDLANWALDRTEEILESPSKSSWTARWLQVLHDLAEAGEHHDFPPYGYGDETSVALVTKSCRALNSSGAIRHGAECFNYHFPQELDEEYLIVWDGYQKSSPDSQPWEYVNEYSLREFLIERANEGYTFPVNPVWPIRDSGWYSVLQALRSNEGSKQSLSAWLPESSGLLDRIDSLYQRYPTGFTVIEDQEFQVQEKRRVRCSTCREDAELIIHSAKRKANKDEKKSKIPRPHLPHLHAPTWHSHSHKKEPEDGTGTTASGATPTPQKRPSFFQRLAGKSPARNSKKATSAKTAAVVAAC